MVESNQKEIEKAQQVQVLDQDHELVQDLQNQLEELKIDQTEEGEGSEFTESNIEGTMEESKGPGKKKKSKKKSKPVPKGDGPASNLRSRIKEFQASKQQNLKPKVGVVFDEEMLLHKNHSEHHPERPERIMAIYLNLVKKGNRIYDQLIKIDAEPADDAILELVHPYSHIQKVKDTIYDSKLTEKWEKVPLRAKQNTRRFQSDTYENKFTAQSAFLSAGGTIEGARAVCSGQVDYSFCIVRPPGHHAGCGNAAGFCFFNNAGIAARFAQKEFGLKKVCIFDWDVHVGDGTSEIFYEDDSVLYISIHRYDNGKFYPGPAGKLAKTGEGKGRGYNIHYPFNFEKAPSKLIGDSDYIYVCETLFFPVIKEFAPDFIIISAGFDSALGDPLGQVGVSPVGYAYITQGLRQIQNKLMVVLEGGYDLGALEISSEAVVQTLRVNYKEQEEMDKLLQDYNSDKSLPCSMEQLRIQALLHPREQFQQTVSKVAKVLVKQWPFLESLINDKLSRKSSQRQSNVESDDNSVISGQERKQSTNSQSYQVPEPIKEQAE